MISFHDLFFKKICKKSNSTYLYIKEEERGMWGKEREKVKNFVHNPFVLQPSIFICLSIFVFQKRGPQRYGPNCKTEPVIEQNEKIKKQNINN